MPPFIRAAAASRCTKQGPEGRNGLEPRSSGLPAEETSMTTQTVETAKPESLRFGYGDTALGTIVVAEGTRGIAALFIGDDRARLLHDLREAFPGVELVLDQTGLAQTIAEATALVDAPHVATDLALDLRGSPV